MPEWLSFSKATLWWIGISSVVFFLLFLASVFIILSRIPSDYFTRRRTSRREGRSPLGWLVVILKNLLGVVLLIVGLILLLLPGQGILTILVGLMMVDFPGKRALEGWILQRPGVEKGINWIREKAGKPPLEIPPPKSQK